MKIKIQSTEIDESLVQSFALFLGWKETDNQTYIEYISDRYGSPIWNDLASFNLQQKESEAQALRQQANTIIEDARVLAHAHAKEVVTVVE